MKIYGLVGHPLSHSFSKGFFNDKFKIENIDAEYKNFDISDINLFTDIIQQNVSGLNVTIPYKQMIIPFLDEMDDTALKIGAVNVVKIINEQDRKILKGFNSDEIGFRQSLQPLLKDSHRKALILGTGGASKAVFYSLEKLGIEPLYVSRHFAPGQITYEQLTPEIMQQYTVVVNTTPLGMYPNIETKPEIPYQYITDKHLCYDLVYNPQVTAFMNSCSQNGAIVKNGYEMLVLQALAAWKIWND